MNKDMVFKDSKNVFWVLGDKRCALTDQLINSVGFIRLTNNRFIYLSLSGVKESKRMRSVLDEYYQFFVTDSIGDDFILVNMRSSSLVDAKNVSIFDVDKINKYFPSKTIDRTRFADRGGLDDSVLIGSPDFDRIVLLDKPLVFEKEVDSLLDSIMNSQVVVDSFNLLEVDKHD